MFETDLRSIFDNPQKTVFEAPKEDKPAPVFSFDLDLSEGQQLTPPPHHEGGRVTLRMSHKAKKRLLQLHAREGKRKQAIFRQLLDSSPLDFQPSDLGGHDSKASFNVILTTEQRRRIEAARARYDVPMSSLISALLLVKP